MESIVNKYESKLIKMVDDQHPSTIKDRCAIEKGDFDFFF